MKLTFTLYLPFLLLGLASCYTSNRMLVDDDVYLLKSNVLPVGESLNDETSYAAFVHKNKRGVQDRDYFIDRRLLLASFQHPFFGMYGISNRAHFWGYNYSLFLYPGFEQRLFMMHAYQYGFSPFHMQGFGYSPFMYGDGFNSYSGFGNQFTVPTGGIPSNITASNSHRGPRGSISGFGNPSGRNNNAAVLKSQTTSSANSFQSRPIQMAKSIAREEISNKPNYSRGTQVNRENTASYRPPASENHYNGSTKHRGTNSSIFQNRSASPNELRRPSSEPRILHSPSPNRGIERQSQSRQGGATARPSNGGVSRGSTSPGQNGRR
jgi:hypothetical protein